MNSPYSARLESLRKLLKKEPFDLIAVNSSQSQTYFTGMHFHLSERTAVLLVGKDKESAFIFPEFESEKVRNAPVQLQVFSFTENISDWGPAFQHAISYFGNPDPVIGIEPTAMRFLELDLLRYKNPGVKFTSAAHIFESMRSRKDVFEIQDMRKAIQIAETALLKTLPLIKPGVSEIEIANELVINLLREGSEPVLPFSPIVASGPNSANPHAVPGDRQFESGDLLLIDYGARFNGYISDITRTFAIGEIDSKLKEIYEVVQRANQSARSASNDELISKTIDHKARKIIEDAGFGEFFTHRTGHGIGLEPHEAPYISKENDQIIESGMTFTIEPGIYLPGKGGVRIEDNMLATENELETMTTLDHNLIAL